jgi:hypothetical protein
MIIFHPIQTIQKLLIELIYIILTSKPRGSPKGCGNSDRFKRKKKKHLAMVRA